MKSNNLIHVTLTLSPLRQTHISFGVYISNNHGHGRLRHGSPSTSKLSKYCHGSKPSRSHKTDQDGTGGPTGPTPLTYQLTAGNIHYCGVGKGWNGWNPLERSGSIVLLLICAVFVELLKFKWCSC
jgi:hypothetical protein